MKNHPIIYAAHYLVAIPRAAVILPIAIIATACVILESACGAIREKCEDLTEGIKRTVPTPAELFRSKQADDIQKLKRRELTERLGS